MHRLWVHEDLLIDIHQPITPSEEQHNDSVRYASADASLTQGVATPLMLEYVYRGEWHGKRRGKASAARVALRWESRRTPEQTVPPSLLYPGARRIRDSPWRFDVK